MVLSATEKATLQTRTLVVLFFGVIGARAAGTLTFTVASLAVLEMLDGERFAGISTVAVTMGTAVSAKLLSSYMQRHGRRPGLVLGFAVAACGLGFTAVGVNQGSLPIFLIGLVLFGVGQGAANLARFAASDLSESSSRGRAISLIVFASTVGAVGGPLLIKPAEQLAKSFDNGDIVGPYAVGALCMVIGATIIQFALRPDPLVAAGGLEPKTTRSPSRPSLRSSLNTIWSNSNARLALIGMVVSQLVMVMVMVMTPAHMKDHGHDQSVVGWVISAHTAGMFMFAPLAGWLSDKLGRTRMIMQGAAILLGSTVVTALAGEAPRILLFPGLFLLGLGWSLGMVSSSALLSESIDEKDRVTAQGSADLITSAISGLGALIAGFIFDSAGYHILSLAGTAIAGWLLVLSFVHHLRVGKPPYPTAASPASSVEHVRSGDPSSRSQSSA